MTRNRTVNVTKLLQNMNIARKVLLSGVFATGSIFQYRGMVMDENGRNGGKWHLAQQTTYHVTLYIFQQLAQHVIIQNNKPHNL